MWEEVGDTAGKQATKQASNEGSRAPLRKSAQPVDRSSERRELSPALLGFGFVSVSLSDLGGLGTIERERVERETGEREGPGFGAYKIEIGRAHV